MIDLVGFTRAITGRRVASGWYASRGAAGVRIFQPHVLYEARDGTLMVDVVQTGGVTSRGSSLPSWRAFTVADLADLRVEERTFEPSTELNLAAPKYHRILAHCLQR
jgi:hypothetical protein